MTREVFQIIRERSNLWEIVWHFPLEKILDTCIYNQILNVLNIPMLIFKSLGKNVGDVLLGSWRRKVTGKSRCRVAFMIAYLFNAPPN